MTEPDPSNRRTRSRLRSLKVRMSICRRPIWACQVMVKASRSTTSHMAETAA